MSPIAENEIQQRVVIVVMVRFRSDFTLSYKNQLVTYPYLTNKLIAYLHRAYAAQENQHSGPHLPNH